MTLLELGLHSDSLWRVADVVNECIFEVPGAPALSLNSMEGVTPLHNMQLNKLWKQDKHENYSPV